MDKGISVETLDVFVRQLERARTNVDIFLRLDHFDPANPKSVTECSDPRINPNTTMYLAEVGEHLGTTPLCIYKHTAQPWYNLKLYVELVAKHVYGWVDTIALMDRIVSEEKYVVQKYDMFKVLPYARIMVVETTGARKAGDLVEDESDLDALAEKLEKERSEERDLLQKLGAEPLDILPDADVLRNEVVQEIAEEILMAVIECKKKLRMTTTVDQDIVDDVIAILEKKKFVVTKNAHQEFHTEGTYITIQWGLLSKAKVASPKTN